MVIPLLMWGLTFSYAMAESGRQLIGHKKLSTIGAILGQSPISPITAQAIVNGATTGIGAKIVAYATAQLGKPYHFGTPQSCTGNPSSFDCSGLTRCAVLAATGGGINLAHHAATQIVQLARYAVPKNNPNAWLPGDIIYYFIPSEIATGEPAHCAIYIGGGKVIDAPHTGTVVRIDNYKLGTIMGVRRPAAYAGKIKTKAAAKTPAAAASAKATTAASST